MGKSRRRRSTSRRGTLNVAEIEAARPLTLPASSSEIDYDEVRQSLRIGGGSVSGVSRDVWAFKVSGMQVVKKWLSYRTRRGAGRATSSGSPLDQIRPAQWPDEWTIELLELLSILHRTVELKPQGNNLLDHILGGSLISASELPAPPAVLRKPPGNRRGPKQAALEL